MSERGEVIAWHVPSASTKSCTVRICASCASALAFREAIVERADRFHRTDVTEASLPTTRVQAGVN